MNHNTSARALAAFVGFAGISHFVRPTFFDAIVPRPLPGSARSWTYVSGAAEVAVAAAVVNPASRRWGSIAAAALFVAVFPANVQAAIDARTAAEKALTWARLPLQIPLVRWALKVRHAG